MDTFEMMDMYWEYVNEVCPEKWESANEWSERIDYGWHPEVLEAYAIVWGYENECYEKEFEDMNTFEMMDMYEKHIDEFCPEKWDSANEFAEGVDYEWEPEVLAAKAEAWAMENDCLGDDNEDYYESDWSSDEEEMDTFEMMDMYWEHVNEFCPEKWDSANMWSEGVDYEWDSEVLEAYAIVWANENDCLGPVG
jgi:hypothetical protein